MVNAIVSGQKTQTRRPVKSKTGFYAVCMHQDGTPYEVQETDADEFWTDKQILPMGFVDDVFWIRETWQVTDFLHPSDENYGYIYKASENGKAWESNTEDWKWRPSIHMPKEAARLFLKVKDVRLEKIRQISEEDAIAEGFKSKLGFEATWVMIYGEEHWDHNQWAWVYEFELIDQPREWPE